MRVRKNKSKMPVEKRNKILSGVNNELAMFADSLIPSNEGTELSGNSSLQDGDGALDLEGMTGIQIVNHIFRALKSRGVYKIPKTFIGGSVGKKTSVLFSDFDAVIFLKPPLASSKDLKPPLSGPIRYFYNFLKHEAATFGILPESTSYTSNSVHVDFENGMDMDLLPAAFYDSDPEKQRLKVHEEIKAIPEKCINYSSSLVETQIAFLKEQTSAVHQAIRLLKFWFKSLIFDEHLYGGSYLMEVICVAAWHENDRRDKVYEILKLALEKIANIDSLKIAFLRENGNWKLLSQEEINKKKNEFAPYILARPAYVIDPSNPWNDLIKFNPEHPDQAILILQASGKEMLTRIISLASPKSDEFKQITQTEKGVEVTLNISKLFEPHYLKLKNVEKAMPTSIVVHYDYMEYKLPIPKVDFKNDAIVLDIPDAEKVAEAVKTNLVTLIRLLATREGNNGKYFYKKGLAVVETKEEVKKAVGKLLDINFAGVKREETGKGKEHQDCDVTMLIPYICKEKCCAVRLSMKFGKALKRRNQSKTKGLQRKKEKK